MGNFNIRFIYGYISHDVIWIRMVVCGDNTCGSQGACTSCFLGDRGTDIINVYKYYYLCD